jgi:hypothetical protein
MALGRASLFGKNTNIVVASCTTFLCMISLYWLFVPSAASQSSLTGDARAWLTLGLFPYAVLALVVLVLFLSIVLKRMFSSERRSDLQPVNGRDGVVAKTRPDKAFPDGPQVR